MILGFCKTYFTTLRTIKYSMKRLLLIFLLLPFGMTVLHTQAQVKKKEYSKEFIFPGGIIPNGIPTVMSRSASLQLAIVTSSSVSKGMITGAGMRVCSPRPSAYPSIIIAWGYSLTRKRGWPLKSILTIPNSFLLTR